METIETNKVQILWSDDYYDGPLSGMAVCDGETLYFKLNHHEGNSRCFALYRLTSEQLSYELEVHELFRKYVGTHCDYTDGSRNSYEGLRPKYMWKNFYDTERKELDLSESEFIGYFME